MASLTLSIPNKLKEEMGGFKYINWSEIARTAIINKLRFLENMEEILKKSTLTAEDTVKYGRALKKRQWKKTRELLK